MKIRDNKNNIITEAFSPYTLEKAMEEQRVISIYYDSPHDTTNDKGWRRIEPFVYGQNKHGNNVIRAWQIGGSSDTPEGKEGDPLSKMPGWRMFRIDGIKNINIGGGSKVESPRPKYNPDDKDMNKIYLALDFGDDGTVETLREPSFSGVTTKDNDKDREIPQKDNKPLRTPEIEPREKPEEEDEIKPLDDPRLSNKPSWVRNLINLFNNRVKSKK